MGTMRAFGLFACIFPAAATLDLFSPPELFPTHLRASGVGLAVASSRFGSAISTFLLPLAVQHAGIHASLGVCVAVLLFGGVFCHMLAPETGGESLSDVKSDAAADDQPIAEERHDASIATSALGSSKTRI